MAKIIPHSRLKSIRKLYKNQKIVLVGGCFDILHPGHVYFLDQAKKRGDLLVVFLESDEKIKRQKGPDRPFYLQKERAFILSFIRPVDIIVLLPDVAENNLYDKLVIELHPDILATTKGNLTLPYLKRSAGLVKAKVVENIKFVKGYSSTNTLQSLKPSP